MDIKLAGLYFIIGGGVAAVAAFFGSQSRSTIAALVSMMPAMSLITICSIYLSAGMIECQNYAKSVIVLLPAWIIYAVILYFLLPRAGMLLTLAFCLLCFFGVAYLLNRLFP